MMIDLVTLNMGWFLAHLLKRYLNIGYVPVVKHLKYFLQKRDNRYDEFIILQILSCFPYNE